MQRQMQKPHTNGFTNMAYPTPEKITIDSKEFPQLPYDLNLVGMTAPSAYGSYTLAPKHVTFVLRNEANHPVKERMPMRVQIFPHDSTDSIVSTVKNFYGIFDNTSTSSGVSFEDEHGMTLIARYENFRNQMVVRVRRVPRAFAGDDGEQSAPGAQESTSKEHTPLRPDSSAPRNGGQFPTPAMNGHSHEIHLANGHSRVNSFASANNNHQIGGSDSGSDAERAHPTLGPKLEQIPSSDISTDNILQGKRRRRNYDSSLELPPLVPRHHASNSMGSSRQSCVHGKELPSPLQGSQRSSVAQYPFPSPLSIGHHEHPYGMKTPQQLQSRHTSFGYPISGISGMTPEPTIASCISDEDIAMQLIRLGRSGPSSGSNNPTKRNQHRSSSSASSETSDASRHHYGDYDGETDADDDDDGDDDNIGSGRRRHVKSPLTERRYRSMSNVLPSCENSVTGSEVDDSDHGGPSKPEANRHNADLSEDEGAPSRKRVRANSATHTQAFGRPGVVENGTRYRATSAPNKRFTNTPSASRVDGKKTHKVSANKNGFRTPRTPANVIPTPSPSRKASSTLSNHDTPIHPDGLRSGQTPVLPPGEEDLSTKPRCQRCRKSKKGCDRQRPCQRCRDAGLSAKDCVSEEEGNGRKGRYGRHMGLPVKKAEVAAANGENILAVAAEMQSSSMSPAPVESPSGPNGKGAINGHADKGKKRKR